MGQHPSAPDHKNAFQVERLAFFSDAVFAIAITLMVIEVKPPHLPEDGNTREVLLTLATIVPSLLGVCLSFFLIGMFWRRHHRLIKHMANYDRRFISLNFAFLITIIFIPFSTSFITENVLVPSPVPLVLYNLNYMLAAIFNYRLQRHIVDPRHALIDLPWDEDVRLSKLHLWYALFVYATVMALAFVKLNVASIAYALFAFTDSVSRFAERRWEAADKRKEALQADVVQSPK